MEEGVAYMMMGEGEGIPQATQLVALQSEDGTQQLAVPVIDPNTGQETYMIIDPNSLESGDGQLMIVGEGEAATLVENVAAGEGSAAVVSTEAALMTASSADGTAKWATSLAFQGEADTSSLSLATSQQNGGGGMMVISTSSDSTTSLGVTNSIASHHDTGAGGSVQVQVQIPQEFQHNPEQQQQHEPQLYQQSSSQNATEQKPNIQDMERLAVQTDSSTAHHHSTIVNVPIPNTPSEGNLSNNVPEQTSYHLQNQGKDTSFKGRQPRKQNLSDFSTPEDEPPTKPLHTPNGLTGDPIQDGKIVDKIMGKITREYNLATNEREAIRRRILTDGVSEAKKYLSSYSLKRAKTLGIRRERAPKQKKKRFIKCDQCEARFPADTEESVLVAHVVNFHVREEKPSTIIEPPPSSTVSTPDNVTSKLPPSPTKSASPGGAGGSPSVVKSYIDPDQADNIGPQLYRCSDCSDGFLTIKSLLDHQRSAHSKTLATPDKVQPVEEKESSQKPSENAETASKTDVSKVSLQQSDKSSDVSQESLSTTKSSNNQRASQQNQQESTKSAPEHSTDDKTHETSESPSPSKDKIEVIRKLADEWDDDEEEDGKETLNEQIPLENIQKSCAAKRPRTDSVKSETLEDISREVADIKAQGKLTTKAAENDAEDKIVADVDDILSDTDALMANVSSVITTTPQKLAKTGTAAAKKGQRPVPGLVRQGADSSSPGPPPAKKAAVRPTAQCEECYECFEDEEKLAWHALQDH